MENNEGYTFSWVQLKPNMQIGLHQQMSWELSYIIYGEGIRLIEGRSESFYADEVILIPPGISHCWYFDKDVVNKKGNIENITITINPTWLEKCAENFKELTPYIERLKLQTNAVMFNKQNASKISDLMKAMHKQNNLERLLSILLLIQEISNFNNTCTVGKKQNISKEQKRLKQVEIYTICNAKRTITIKDIAKFVAMNTSAFCIFFKKQKGKTYITYLNEYRIELACQLLKDKNLAISDVCFQAGFNNVPYFNRLFRSKKGLSPGKWKEKNVTE